MPTTEQIRAAVQATQAVAEAVRERGEIPAGHLYAQVMGSLSLDDFNAILGILSRAGLVEQDGSHLLRWIGPAKVSA